MSYIMEKAGGMSVNGGVRILDMVPKELHEKCGIIVGSPEDVKEYQAILNS